MKSPRDEELRVLKFHLPDMRKSYPTMQFQIVDDGRWPVIEATGKFQTLYYNRQTDLFVFDKEDCGDV